MLDKWEETTLEFMKRVGGNEKANAFWEHRLTEYPPGKPNESSDKYANFPKRRVFPETAVLDERQVRKGAVHYAEVRREAIHS
jgi:hypothetical protein